MNPKELDELSDPFQHIRGRIQVLEGIAVALPTVDARKMQDAMLSAICSSVDRIECLSVRDGSSPMYDPFLSLANVERQHVDSVLKSVDGNKAKASRVLGIQRSTLDRKLKAYQQ